MSHSDKKLTPRKAIIAFCIECMGGGRSGHPDNAVAARRLAASCPAEACPLWVWRPGQKDESAVNRGLASVAAGAGVHKVST